MSDEVEAWPTALILIDGINGFYDPAGATYFPGVEQTIAPVERLLGVAREHRTLVVHAVERHRRVLDDFEWRALPPHYIEGTFDAEIFPRFTPILPLEIVVPKRRFSAFFSTDLLLLLREQGIRRVVLAGCKTNVSIRATAQDAFANGFDVLVAKEATSSNRPAPRRGVARGHLALHGSRRLARRGGRAALSRYARAMTTTSDTESVHGYAAPGFEPLRDALARAVAVDRRGGAALSVVRDGTLIAELVAGSGSDDSTPRTAATTQTCFSCTKGVVAVALLQLIEQGRLELDAPVARYWPEFAEHGKPDVLVRHVVSHMSGQPAFRGEVSSQDLANDLYTESVVAADEPWWPAGTDLSYHSLTYGALCGGLVRRITGASVGAHVQREIASPLGLDLWIGLPEEREPDVAPLHPVPDDELTQLSGHPAQRAALTNPPVLVGPERQLWNSRAYHAGEIPAAGGITTATALARLYGCLATGGGEILRPETVELGRTELSSGQDVLNPEWSARFGVGFMLPTDAEPGYDPLAFGHSGYGGQASGAWPTHRVGVAYLTTALRSGPLADAREADVLGTLAGLLAGAA